VSAEREFGGRVAIVTGGATGIGRAAAERLGAGGASVVIGDVGDGLAQAETELRRAGLQVRSRRADVRSSADMQAPAHFAADAFGGVDVLVCSAGIQRYGTVVDTPEELWDDVLAVNLKGQYLAARHAIPQLRRCHRGRGADRCDHRLSRVPCQPRARCLRDAGPRQRRLSSVATRGTGSRSRRGAARRPLGPRCPPALAGGPAEDERDACDDSEQDDDFHDQEHGMQSECHAGTILALFTP
jgi:NAD(P)-dependent dehydrogenase (short-subunit alcohol dehydrogenase family)